MNCCFKFIKKVKEINKNVFRYIVQNSRLSKIRVDLLFSVQQKTTSARCVTNSDASIRHGEPSPNFGQALCVPFLNPTLTLRHLNSR